MKNNKTVLALVTATVLVWAAGCDQKDSAAKQDLKKADHAAGEAVKDAAEAVKQAGETVAKDVTKKAEELAAPVNSKAQAIIDGAKKLFNDGKIQESLAKLKELGGEKLTAEQKAIADGLKAQIDKMLGTTSKAETEATKAAGNLLK